MNEKKDLSEAEETGFKYGRLLGILKRIDPEAFELVHELSASEGVTPIEIIARAIRSYRDYMVLNAIDPKCLASAMGVMDTLMRRVVGIMNTVIGFFMSDFYRTQMAVFQEMIRGMEEEESEEKKGKKELPPKVREMMANMMASIMSQLMTSLINLTTSMMRTQVPQQQTTLPNTVKESSSFGLGLGTTKKPKIKES